MVFHYFCYYFLLWMCDVEDVRANYKSYILNLRTSFAYSIINRSNYKPIMHSLNKQEKYPFQDEKFNLNISNVTTAANTPPDQMAKCEPKAGTARASEGRILPQGTAQMRQLFHWMGKTHNANKNDEGLFPVVDAFVINNSFHFVMKSHRCSTLPIPG